MANDPLTLKSLHRATTYAPVASQGPYRIVLGHKMSLVHGAEHRMSIDTSIFIQARDKAGGEWHSIAKYKPSDMDKAIIDFNIYTSLKPLSDELH